MSINHSAKVVTDGLLMYYDMSNAQKSWKGAPTTNLSSGMGIGTYLNTPSDVTSVLTQTTDLYKGQPIYKQVLTPITVTGVSQLTNLSNPGIGVVTGGGGGASARYTGHSIYFKAALGRTGLHPSTPIYTHYSNISGWQSSANYDDMGDGWYRAHVIYYNATGAGDGKYWAINPQGAVLNVPITIYWAAPFKEDRNDSTFVSAYTYTSRSTTQAVLDLTGNNTLTASSLTYASDGTFSFNGSTSLISLPSLNLQSDFTLECWVNLTSPGTSVGFFGQGPTVQNQGMHIGWFPGRGLLFGLYGNDLECPSYNMTYNTWHHFVFTYNNSTYFRQTFADGVLVASGTLSVYSGSGQFNIGANFSSPSTPFIGKYAIAKAYNRVLSAAEVAQNFNALRRRYSL